VTEPEQHASIVGALGSPEAEERRQATSRLPQLGLGRAMPLLVRALGDDDWRVRKEATVAARAFEPAPELVHGLIELLAGGDNVGQRNATVEVLASAGAAATPALAEAMGWLDADGRKLAVETLGRGRDPRAIGTLAAALDDGDDNVRQAAMEAIAQVGAVAPEQVRPVLLRALDDRDRMVRLCALEGLRALEIPIPWARLAPLLAEPTLRAGALAAAALSDSAEAAPALASALVVARGSSFDHALAALARLAEGPLAKDVARALEASSAALGPRLVGIASDGAAAPARRAMALELAALARAPGAVEAACAALADDALIEGARRALWALGAPALPALIAKLESEAPPGVRAELVEVIAEIACGERVGEASSAAGARRSASARAARADTPSDDEPAPSPPRAEGALSRPLRTALRVAAHDPDRSVAANALSALSRLGVAEDLPLVASQTRAEVRSVALAAEAALAALAGRFPSAARRLAHVAAGDEGAFVAAAIALGALAARGAHEGGDATLLARIATTGDTRARRAAVLAVAEIGGPVAMEVLNVALTDEEHEVQLATARALGHLAALSDDPSPSELLELVERSRAADLIAAAVRAIGEAFSATYNTRRSLMPPPPATDLVDTLATFARSAPSPVAIAAVDALAQVFAAGSFSAAEALVGALSHPDAQVSRSAAIKLAETEPGREALRRALSHPRAEIRARAAEMLADDGGRSGREREPSGRVVASLASGGAGPSSAPGPSSSRQEPGAPSSRAEPTAPSSRGRPASSRTSSAPRPPPPSRGRR
jgi:HEAT repeat protein